MHRRRKRAETVKVLTCPDCGSSDLYYETGLITGYKYHCKKNQLKSRTMRTNPDAAVYLYDKMEKYTKNFIW
jgi:hypothetical protein